MATLSEIIGYDVIASRPAATTPGALFYASDTDTLYRANGTTWDTLTPGGGGGSALTVREADGTPSDAAVTEIVVPNGTLAIASHVATYTPTAGAAFCGVALRNSGAVSIPNTTFTNATWDTEDYDTDGFHSTVTNTERITIPSGKDGYYQIGAIMPWTGNGTGIFRVQQVHLNGATGLARTDITPHANDRRAEVVSQPVALVAGDYVTMFVYQDSGGALNLLAGEGRFWALKVG